MTSDWPTFWKCRHCHGTGKIIFAHVHVEQCEKCDGTGNAFVDGEAEQHKRRIKDIEGERLTTLAAGLVDGGEG